MWVGTDTANLIRQSLQVDAFIVLLAMKIGSPQLYLKGPKYVFNESKRKT